MIEGKVERRASEARVSQCITALSVCEDSGNLNLPPRQLFFSGRKKTEFSVLLRTGRKSKVCPTLCVATLQNN